MGILESIKSFFSNYANFKGRSRRSAYWWPVLFLTLMNLLIAGLDRALFESIQPIGVVWSLAVLVPSLALGVRRLHDTGKSGWWLLIGLVPVVGSIILIVFFATDSAKGKNQYGPSVKKKS